MDTSTMAQTTIAYKYLPVLISRLVSRREIFTVGNGDPDADVVVYVHTKQDWLDEVANECHGGFVIRLECPDVWRVAEDNGIDISESRYDIAEDVLADVRLNLETVYVGINEAILAALEDRTSGDA